METINKFIVQIFLLIIATIIGGFVFSKLWGWIIVPIFDIKYLTVIEAIGLAFILHYATAKIENHKTRDFEENMKLLLTSIFFNFIALGMGYIISLFIK